MNLADDAATPQRRARVAERPRLHAPLGGRRRVFLLLFMGNFGHNLFRFTWLWYGGFLIIARHCVEVRLAEWEPVPEVEDTRSEEGIRPPAGLDPSPAALGESAPFACLGLVAAQ